MRALISSRYLSKSAGGWCQDGLEQRRFENGPLQDATESENTRTDFEGSKNRRGEVHDE